MRALLVLAALLVLRPFLAAQVAKPPPRGKDNHHQATDWQHPYIEVMVDAWIDCLLPHVGELNRNELKHRLSSPLQNQYPNHAAYDFYLALVRVLQDDLEMTDAVRRLEGGEALIAGGPGIDRALVDGLLERVFETSGDKLRFRHVWSGTGTLAQQQERVLTGDPAQLAQYRSAGARPLTKEQRWAIEGLAARYASCLIDALPTAGSPSSKRRFRDGILECMLLGHADRAVDGLRSRARALIRPFHLKGRKLKTGREHVELDAFLRVEVDRLLGEDLIERFRAAYERALDAPDEVKREVKRWSCADVLGARELAVDASAPLAEDEESDAEAERAPEPESERDAAEAALAASTPEPDVIDAAAEEDPLAEPPPPLTEPLLPELARARAAYERTVDELAADLVRELAGRAEEEERSDAREEARRLHVGRIEAEREGLVERGEWPPSMRIGEWAGRWSAARAALAVAYEREAAQAEARGERALAAALRADAEGDASSAALAPWREASGLVGEGGAPAPWMPVHEAFLGRLLEHSGEEHPALVAAGAPPAGSGGYALELHLVRIQGDGGLEVSVAGPDGASAACRLSGDVLGDAERASGERQEGLSLVALVRPGHVRIDLDGNTVARSTTGSKGRVASPRLALRPDPDVQLRATLRARPLTRVEAKRARPRRATRPPQEEAAPPSRPKRAPIRGVSGSVAAALEWLAAHQEVDGSYDCDRFGARCASPEDAACDGVGEPTHDVGVTGLALLAFVRNGYLPGEGEHDEIVARGVGWLRGMQDDESGRLGDVLGHTFLYDHMIGVRALCERLPAVGRQGAGGARAARDPLRRAGAQQDRGLALRRAAERGERLFGHRLGPARAARRASGRDRGRRASAGSGDQVHRTLDRPRHRTRRLHRDRG